MKINFRTWILCFSLMSCSFVIAQTVSTQTGSSQKEMKMDHSHMPISVPESAKPVALSLLLIKDAMSGFNLTLQTQHYNLMPPRQGLSMAESMSAMIDEDTGYVEGHAHLYINGEKIQRIYGRNIHLPETLFKQGTNSISVTLNNHGHMAWTQDDKKIVSTLYVDDLEGVVKYQFDSFPTVARDNLGMN